MENTEKTMTVEELHEKQLNAAIDRYQTRMLVKLDKENARLRLALMLTGGGLLLIAVIAGYSLMFPLF